MSSVFNALMLLNAEYGAILDRPLPGTPEISEAQIYLQNVSDGLRGTIHATFPAKYSIPEQIWKKDTFRFPEEKVAEVRGTFDPTKWGFYEDGPGPDTDTNVLPQRVVMEYTPLHVNVHLYANGHACVEGFHSSCFAVPEFVEGLDSLVKILYGWESQDNANGPYVPVGGLTDRAEFPEAARLRNHRPRSGEEDMARDHSRRQAAAVFGGFYDDARKVGD